MRQPQAPRPPARRSASKAERVLTRASRGATPLCLPFTRACLTASPPRPPLTARRSLPENYQLKVEWNCGGGLRIYEKANGMSSRHSGCSSRGRPRRPCLSPQCQPPSPRAQPLARSTTSTTFCRGRSCFTWQRTMTAPSWATCWPKCGLRALSGGRRAARSPRAPAHVTSCLDGRHGRNLSSLAQRAGPHTPRPPPSPPPTHREEEPTDGVHGHITSLAVARSHRKQGIASRLMTATRARRGPGRAGDGARALCTAAARGPAHWLPRLPVSVSCCAVHSSCGSLRSACFFPSPPTLNTPPPP